ncbi:DNA- binding [Blomia tropicalis]|nr:DNA- binding [Blomia tropicalis]
MHQGLFCATKKLQAPIVTIIGPLFRHHHLHIRLPFAPAPSPIPILANSGSLVSNSQSSSSSSSSSSLFLLNSSTTTLLYLLVALACTPNPFSQYTHRTAGPFSANPVAKLAIGRFLFRGDMVQSLLQHILCVRQTATPNKKERKKKIRRSIVDGETKQKAICPLCSDLYGSIYLCPNTVIQLRNWKPLSLDQISESVESTIGDIFGDIASFITLRIRLFSLICTKSEEEPPILISLPRMSAAHELKDKLLQVLLAHSYSILANTGSPIDQCLSQLDNRGLYVVPFLALQSSSSSSSKVAFKKIAIHSN